VIIYLCYGYKPDTTAVYFERALRRDHEVYYIGPGYGAKPGYPTNVDLLALMQQGLPRPDLVLFIESGVPLFPRGLEKLACPPACYLVDVHQSLWVRELYAPFFDCLFVAQRDYVAHFQRLGYPNVFWLPLACDPELHGQRDLPRTFDVGFVGALEIALELQIVRRVGEHQIDGTCGKLRHLGDAIAYHDTAIRHGLEFSAGRPCRRPATRHNHDSITLTQATLSATRD